MPTRPPRQPIWHPSREALAQLAHGIGSPATHRRAVAHLLHGCRRCAGALRREMRPAIQPEEYGPVIERVTRRVLAAARQGDRREQPVGARH